MANVTFGSKVSQKATACKPKTINYIRHADGSLSLKGVKLTPAQQRTVELQLEAQNG